ncbi:unnamed protein product [Somion occarium]|uniref:Uncharacterized protein n=1 Tax=Somion occarium TaxID=3059160 RepID=A0ABP1CT75_9APHY
MTEYSMSSEALREFRSTQERTAYWVDQYTRYGAEEECLSPSAPPSVISDVESPSSGSSDSDNWSRDSIPPRMVLHFEDGRPDIPISHDYPRPSRMRPRVPVPESDHQAVPHSSSRHGPSRSGSQHLPVVSVPSSRTRHGQTLSYVTVPPAQSETPRPRITPPPLPENIVVLPSRESEQSDHSPTPIVSRAIDPSHHGDGSHSRSPTSHSSQNPHRNANAGPPPHRSLSSPIASPSPRHAYPPTQVLPRNHSPAMMYSQSQPLPLSTNGGVQYLEQQAAAQSRPGSRLPYNYSPPAIIYAPSSKHSRPRYAPPPIVYSPPNGSHGLAGRYPAPSMVHSQSAPVPQPGVAYPPPPQGSNHRSHHSHSHSHSHPPHQSHHSSSHSHENSSHSRSLSRGRAREMMAADRPHSSHARSHSHKSVSRHRTRTPSRSRSPSDSDSEAGSISSNGTYYILPTPGQKVQIIVPNSSSVYTATSTTKSAHSPNSAHSGGYKKPFFQRIFHMPKFSAPSVDSRGSGGSRGSGRRLQRRHTIGGARIQPPVH